MVLMNNNQGQSRPLELVVTGDVSHWLPAVGKIVGPELIHARQARSDRELLSVVRDGQVDAAVLDDVSEAGLDVLPLLRMIRRVNQQIPVVVVTNHNERQWLENALRLAAFSVVVKPLELEEFLRQIHSIMVRLHRLIHHGRLP